MIRVLLALFLIAASQAAVLVPSESSQVDVRRAGSDFSYNIQENRVLTPVQDSLLLSPSDHGLITSSKTQKEERKEEIRGKIEQSQVVYSAASQRGELKPIQDNLKQNPESLAYAAPISYYPSQRNYLICVQSFEYYECHYPGIGAAIPQPQPFSPSLRIILT